MARTPTLARDRPAPRRVVVNGEPIETCARTLADLLSETGYGEAKVATARNGAFVAARLRAETFIEQGDLIEIVAPRAGG
jgi:sulfur carrier protein